MKGHNFKPWFQRRRAVAEQEQYRLWRQARMNANVREFIDKLSELEIVETFNAIERHLLAEMQASVFVIALYSFVRYLCFVVWTILTIWY